MLDWKDCLWERERVGFADEDEESLLWCRRRKKMLRPRVRAIDSRTATTMPAITPGEALEFFLGAVLEEFGVETGRMVMGEEAG